jgi:hypothetical protein
MAPELGDWTDDVAGMCKHVVKRSTTENAEYHLRTPSHEQHIGDVGLEAAII